MRVLTGVQPTGKLHWGNYFGALRPALDLQEQHETFLFIANYHSLTSLHDPETLKRNTLDIALDYLACGLDPEKSVFYRQSDVPQVTELTWLLSVLTPMGLLERATSYKDKVAKGMDATHGLFSYPVLMAADILAVNAELVPVGKDQKQHLEITRDIAGKFNLAFGETFTIPDPMIQEHGAVVPGTDGQKMSKSYNNTIPVFGSAKQLKQAVMSIVTDSKELDDPKDPDTCNVFALYKLFASHEQQEDLAGRYRAGGLGYGHAKKELLELATDYFAPMKTKREELENNLDYVDEVMAKGSEKAAEVINPVMVSVRKAMGIN